MPDRRLPTLAQLAGAIGGACDESSKPELLWGLYDSYLAPLRTRPLRILEIGIWKGLSLQVFSAYFPNARIVGFDLNVPELDPSSIPNVTMIQGNQMDTYLLQRISTEHAPEGWDIIIDDGAHSGTLSLMDFEALFPALKSGGLYFVEHWASGYMPGWGDGGQLEPARPYDPDDHGFGRRIATHDYGMVGFVKALIDRAYFPAAVFEWLHIHNMVVVGKKL